MTASVRAWGKMQETAILPQATSGQESVGDVFRKLARHPVQCLVRKWNWKSAVLSSLVRGAIFFLANLSAGLPAAKAALVTELVFRGFSSGVYGALTESFCEAEPEWAAALAGMLLLPAANHSVELLVHWARGTHNLSISILASVGFTGVSTLFNLYAMRRGALRTGCKERSLAEDLKAMPGLFLGFVLALPRGAMRIGASRNPERPVVTHATSLGEG